MSKSRSDDPSFVSLKAKKAATDKYLKTHTKQMLVLVKVPNKKDFVYVYNGKWPNEVEYTLNILKNKNGNIIYVSQSPFSESGDWDISYEHYFDEEGNVFAFYKEESIFDENVKGGVVRSKLLNYYNKNFKIITQNNWLVDVNGNVIKANKNDFDFRDYNYTIYKNLADCLKGYNIKAF
ncbi:MAG: hypothetical protein V4456_22275 [Bacteroidota bacterium]